MREGLSVLIDKTDSALANSICSLSMVVALNEPLDSARASLGRNDETLTERANADTRSSSSTPDRDG